MLEVGQNEPAAVGVENLPPAVVNAGLVLALLNQYAGRDEANPDCPDAPRSVRLQEVGSSADLLLSSGHGSSGLECSVAYGNETWWLGPASASVIHGYVGGCPAHGRAAADGMTFKRIDSSPLTGLGEVLAKFSTGSVEVVAERKTGKRMRRVAAGLGELLRLMSGR